MASTTSRIFVRLVNQRVLPSSLTGDAEDQSTVVFNGGPTCLSQQDGGATSLQMKHVLAPNAPTLFGMFDPIPAMTAHAFLVDSRTTIVARSMDATRSVTFQGFTFAPGAFVAQQTASLGLVAPPDISGRTAFSTEQAQVYRIGGLGTVFDSRTNPSQTDNNLFVEIDCWYQDVTWEPAEDFDPPVPPYPSTTHWKPVGAPPLRQLQNVRYPPLRQLQNGAR